MTLMGNVCYVELNSDNFILPFVIEIELLKSEFFCVLCEIQAILDT